MRKTYTQNIGDVIDEYLENLVQYAIGEIQMPTEEVQEQINHVKQVWAEHLGQRYPASAKMPQTEPYYQHELV